jgi:hypothetical protein
MSQLNPFKNAASADQIYFDITVSNLQSTITEPPVFYFNEQRSSPFIMNPEDYYLSILRFTVETGTLPVFIPVIQPNQGNRDLTIYSLQLEWEDPATSITYTSGETFLTFFPQNKAAPLPPPPNATANGIQNNAGRYYDVYNYSVIPLLVNYALQVAFNALQTAVVAGGAALPSGFAPVMTWDSSSDSAVLYFDTAGYNFYFPAATYPVPPAGYAPIRLFFNAPLYGLFPSFPAEYLGYAPALSGKNFLFTPFNVGGLNNGIITPFPVPTPPLPATWTSTQIYQEYSTIANFSPIVALVFTSNTLPIQPNQVSTPLVINNAQQVVLGGNNSDFANVITDLVSDTGQYKPNLTYNPTSEYRLITLYGNRPLSNIDIQVYWRDKFGRLNPFRLASGEAITIKVAFLKKGTYNKKASD